MCTFRVKPLALISVNKHFATDSLLLKQSSLADSKNCFHLAPPVFEI